MSKKLTTEEFIEKAREVHGDKYDYSKVEYVNTHVKVCIICPKHGEFWQTPHDHLKSECKECYNEKRGDLSRSNAEEFIKKAKLIHGDKYDYSKVNYLNNRTNVIIICPIHGEFTQTPNTHLNGSGCYQCNKHNGGVKQKFNKDFFLYLTLAIGKRPDNLFAHVGNTAPSFQIQTLDLVLIFRCKTNFYYLKL